MDRIGIVTEVKGSQVTVELERHSACGDCGMCGHASESKCFKVKTRNTIDAVVGEKVMVEMPDQSLVKVAMIVYTIPLIALIIGVMLGNVFITQLQGEIKDLMSFLLGVIFMGGTFIWVKQYDKKSGVKYQVKISKIL